MSNNFQKARVGGSRDKVGIPYEFGNNTIYGHLNTSYYHVHGESFVLPLYADAIRLTSASGSWATTGTKFEVIPAVAMDRPFDLHWVSITNISASLQGIVDIFAGEVGSEIKIGAVDVQRSTNFSRESALPVQIPQQPANTRISARFTDNTTSERTVDIKLYGHFYG